MSLKFNIPLWNHQTEALEQFDALGHLLLAHPTGTGKTATAIHCYRLTCARRKKLLKCLILCPCIVVENWKREIEKHASSFVYDAVQILTGKNGHDKARHLRDPKKKIFITNHESLRTDLFEHLIAYGFDFLIVDESHRYKNPTAEMTKRLLTLSRLVPYKMGLTGTPILQSALDLYPQLKVLDVNLVSKSWYEFRAKYFFNANADNSFLNWPDWRMRPGVDTELNAILARVSHRVDKKEALPDLPPLVRQNVYVELPPILRQHYEEMEKEFLTFLDGSEVSADIALVKLLRLQQIVNGIFKVNEVTTKKLHSSKTQALKELLADICPGSKAIVWTNFIPTYDDIATVCNELKLNYVKLVGEQSASERTAAIDAFQTDDTVSVCIANQQTASEGVNLQAASYAIYYSKNFNLGHDVQSEARCYRGGSERHKKITRIDIVTKGTIEEDVNDALERKLKLAELITNVRKKAA